MKNDIDCVKFHNDLVELLMDILREYIRICDKYGLMYFVVGGSALGAVRHGGFIPWDDDIDVAMPRDDYMKFLGIAVEELRSPFFLQNYRTEPDFRLDYTKIRNSNTTFVEKTAQSLHINHGVYIDIFPIDGYPSAISEIKTLEFKKRLYRLYLGKDYGCDYSWKGKILLTLEKILWKNNVSKVSRKLEDLYLRYDYASCDRVICHGGIWGKREICDKSQYGKGKMVKFEDVDVRIPEHDHEYLTQKYDNYMELPPVEKQVSHHDTLFVDLNRSYKEYLKIDENGNNLWDF